MLITNTKINNSSRVARMCCRGVFLFFALTEASMVLALSTQTQPVQAIEEIVSTAKQYMQDQLSKTAIEEPDYEIQLGKLDPRLKLHACDAPLEAFLPPSAALSGKSSIGVRCATPKPWSIYIPVEINTYQQVITAVKPLTRGHIIEEQDITSLRVKINAAHNGYFTVAQDVIGMVVRRPIATGKMLDANLLSAPKLIKRGELVTLMAKTPLLQVRMQGLALSDGTKGELIRVRNTRTNRIVEGIVMRSGVVEVQM